MVPLSASVSTRYITRGGRLTLKLYHLQHLSFLTLHGFPLLEQANSPRSYVSAFRRRQRQDDNGVGEDPNMMKEILEPYIYLVFQPLLLCLETRLR